ncbi:MAG: hypothetical protein ACXQT4_05125 [Methanotrichaceae archaeon]
MEDFEWKLTAALNSFFEKMNIKAIAYRLKQSRYTSQVVDVLVDSPHPEYYQAIECKSLDARKTKMLYFSQHFSTLSREALSVSPCKAGKKQKGVHQIERADEFLSKSGRRGILAVELRRGPGRPKRAHLVPWKTVIERYKAESVGLNLDEIEACPALKRKGKTYVISKLR